MEKRGTLYTEIMGVDGETWVDAFHICHPSKAQLVELAIGLREAGYGVWQA